MLFRVALFMMKTALGTPEKLSECPSFHETLEKLRMRQLPSELQDEEFLVKEVCMFFFLFLQIQWYHHDACFAYTQVHLKFKHFQNTIMKRSRRIRTTRQNYNCSEMVRGQTNNCYY